MIYNIFMKDGIYITIIAILTFVICLGVYFFKNNNQIDLDYYQAQNLLVNKNFGVETQQYHPVLNPIYYCFNNKLFKVCFRKHE